MEIRLMTMADYESVYDMWINTPGMGLNDLDDSAEGIERYLSRNPDTCFVAVEGERVVGVILSGHDGRRGFIHHTAVAPDMRRRGIAGALLDAAIDALRGKDIVKVALVVFKKNEPGNAFWEEKGFILREDISYRNITLREHKEMHT